MLYSCIRRDSRVYLIFHRRTPSRQGSVLRDPNISVRAPTDSSVNTKAPAMIHSSRRTDMCIHGTRDAFELPAVELLHTESVNRVKII